MSILTVTKRNPDGVNEAGYLYKYETEGSPIMIMSENFMFTPVFDSRSLIKIKTTKMDGGGAIVSESEWQPPTQENYRLSRGNDLSVADGMFSACINAGIISQELCQKLLNAINIGKNYHDTWFYYGGASGGWNWAVYNSGYLNIDGTATIDFADYMEVHRSGLSNNLGVSLKDSLTSYMAMNYPHYQTSLTYKVFLRNLPQDIADGIVPADDELKKWLEENTEIGDFTNNRAEWFVNVDGTKNPTMTITWKGNNIENGFYSDKSATIQVRAYEKGANEDFKNVGIYAYKNKPIKFSWNYIAELTNSTALNKILNNIFDDLNGLNIFLNMRYISEGQEYTTSTCGFTIDYDGTADESWVVSPTDGSTIIISYGSSDDFYKEHSDDNDDINTNNNSGGNGIAILTKTYAMNEDRLRQLGSFLWNNDFLDVILGLNNCPIENIVSVKCFPFAVSGGSDESIILGNVDTGVYGKPVGTDYANKKIIGSITIPTYYEDTSKDPRQKHFLDCAPFIKITIFLPYIGFKEINPNIFIGHVLKVEYINDLITGTCKAVLYSDNILICDFSGQIGLDIPISASNRGQVEMAQIQNGTNALMAASSGNISGVLSNTISIASAQYHTQTTGTPSPCTSNFETHDVFIIIDRPIVEYPSNYLHVNGKPCRVARTLNSLSGFCQIKECDMGGVSCTDAEKTMIYELLKSGVYL